MQIDTSQPTGTAPIADLAAISRRIRAAEFSLADELEAHRQKSAHESLQLQYKILKDKYFRAGQQCRQLQESLDTLRFQRRLTWAAVIGGVILYAGSIYAGGPH